MIELKGNKTVTAEQDATTLSPKHGKPHRTRHVKPNPMVSIDEYTGFCTNEIRTSRYTVLTFLPLSIMIQFTKIANVAWLIVMILNCFPQIRINSPAAVAAVLGAIIFIGVLKEGLSDLSRHKSDKKTNETPVRKIGTLEAGDKHKVNICLRDVKVGDILVLKDKEQIPADCVVLQVTNETGGFEGFI
jgi:magnesium-transporting ATPase (P-type)